MSVAEENNRHNRL